MLRVGIGVMVVVAALVVPAPLAGTAEPAGAVRAVSAVGGVADGDAPFAVSDAERRDRPEDRFALAGGCYAVRSVAVDRYVARYGDGFAASAGAVSSAEPFLLRATDLGRYLLYGAERDHLAAADGLLGLLAPSGVVTSRAAPTTDADWVVDQVGPDVFTFRLTGPAGAAPTAPGGGGETTRTLVVTRTGELAVVAGDGGGEAAQFGFERTEGCAAFPEVDLNVTGAHPTGATPYEEVRGYLDAHLHMMAFEFLGGAVHCGRPWHRFGVAHALVDCPDHRLASGAGAVLENFLSGGELVATHDPVGWPTFVDWPAPSSLTHEQVYYRWMERAWRGGLRMFVNLFVDNGVLCELYPLGTNSCDEMDGVRLQVQRIRELERYIDAQSGGPGEGWFRIVTDPFEARRVMNEGRLAVVLGIEVSELFGCSLSAGEPQCTTAEIDRQLDEVHRLGVRQLELVNKFDNALAGVAGDGGTTGIVVNTGNFLGTGRFWDLETCDHDHTGVHDKDQLTVPGGIAEQDALFGAIVGRFAPPGAVPLYPEPHHCNTRGLSPLGAHTVEAMIDRQMIFDPDHMSVLARQQSLELLADHGYSGVISSHGWSTPDAYERIYGLGGVITPYAGSSAGFVDAWREHRRWRDDRYLFGIGYGADANGLGAQGAARGAAAQHPVRYPFEGFGGVTVDRQVSGERTYDINVDGVAHYGLYPDWVEDLRRLAGDEILDDMARGPEAYLQMWERAVGVTAPGCRGAGQLDSLRSGMAPEEVLAAAGQPERRTGRTFVYCIDGAWTERLAVEFDDQGRLARTARLAGGAARAETAQEPADATAGEVDDLDHDAGGATSRALDDHVRAATCDAGETTTGPLAGSGAAVGSVLALAVLTALLGLRLRHLQRR
ncbi:hypothetical protein BH20ACT2_BH20ACT2_14840 [soil metagenome]